jgi:hypothetical protein
MKPESNHSIYKYILAYKNKLMHKGIYSNMSNILIPQANIRMR